MKRKLLVIGKEGRLEKNSPDKTVFNKYDITYIPMGASDEVVISSAPNTEYIIVDAIGVVSGKVIKSLPKLKIIHSEGVGFQGVDTEAAAERGVYVCNCKGMNASAVAEQAILLMLGLLRNVVGCDASARAGNQITVKENYMLSGSLKELSECTVGIVGLGDIGRATAKLVSAFGGKILYYNRTRADKNTEEECSATYSDLDNLLAASDIVSLHLPVSKSTIHIANSDFFKKMKPSAYLINTARGELVDNVALINALNNGEISGAGLDTIEGEPVLANNNIFNAPKETLNKLLLSCHIGGITGASFARGYEMIWSNFEKVAQGKRPEHIVNKI